MKINLRSLLLFMSGILIVSLNSCLKNDPNEAIGVINDDISIYQIRSIWKGNEVGLNKNLLGGASYTSGVVISRAESRNFPDGYIAIESNWREQIRGILVKVENPADYKFGDSLIIKLDNARLSKQSGALSIEQVSEHNIQVLAFGRDIIHKAISIGNLLSTPDNYESTLVSITSDVDGWTEGTILEGRHSLQDGNGNEIFLQTSSESVFKNKRLAPNATFRGIVLRNSSDELDLYMQDDEDMVNPSGKLYAGWPESFEDPDPAKGSYNMPDIDNVTAFATGNWYLYYAIVGNTGGRDRIVTGENAIRVQQNRTEDSYIQMDFDVPNGASKVTFWYGCYYTDRSSTFKLEYSTDQGLTWIQTGPDITNAKTTAESKDAQLATFLMDIQEPVRFRINKLGLGTSSPAVSNGRLGVDDFSIYEAF